MIKEVIIIDRGLRGHVGVSTSLSDQDVVVFGLPKFRETIATTSWYLWWEHRKVTHGEEVQDADQINMVVRALAANFVLACAQKARVCTVRWTKPRSGYVQLNVDAGFDVDSLFF